VLSGGKPNVRYSLLEHVWTLAVPAGHNYSMRVQAHHTANSENDHFQFLYSLDNSAYVPMLTVTKTADDDIEQTYAFPEDVAGTLYVKVKDTDHTAGKKALDTVHVDRLAVAVDTSGTDVTSPPAKPKGLSALAGNAQVSLDWTDSSAPDLSGYVVSRSTVSGGPLRRAGRARRPERLRRQHREQRHDLLLRRGRARHGGQPELRHRPGLGHTRPTRPRRRRRCTSRSSSSRPRL
jgi:hypothetical protein